MLTVAACGGGTTFDSAAVVERLELEATDDVVKRSEELCLDTDDALYEWTLIGYHDTMDVTSMAAQAIGCPDRYTPVADRYGWPTP